jgi:TPR repeat protein
MIVNGRGGPRDPAAAQALFEKAAAKGHSGAMFALGALHSGGHRLPIDRTAAQRWFRAAAELGHGHAQLMLGRYLVDGVAGNHDLSEGRLWLERAAAQGIPDADADLAKLGSSTHVTERSSREASGHAIPVGNH